MNTTRIFLAAALLAFGTWFPVFGFDISVYFDPVSAVRITADQTAGFADTCDCQSWDYDCKLDAWLSSVANNEEAIRLWQEMGVNRLCVYYALDDFADLPAGPDTVFKVINYRWPEHMYQFIEAQKLDNC